MSVRVKQYLITLLVAIAALAVVFPSTAVHSVQEEESSASFTVTCTQDAAFVDPDEADATH